MKRWDTSLHQVSFWSVKVAPRMKERAAARRRDNNPQKQGKKPNKTDLLTASEFGCVPNSSLALQQH